VTYDVLRVYAAAMLVEESRILEVSIVSTLHNNLRSVDVSKVLPDVVTIADEVDSIEAGHGRL
jgi:hypothetical protein